MTREVVAFAGISGVGKSTLIGALAASVPLEHVQAGALIKAGRASIGEVRIGHDQLRFADIDENQKLLIRGFELRTKQCKGLIIVDGHTLIEHNDGVTLIDPRVFREIGISSMVFVNDDPRVISQRRHNDSTRTRPVSSVSEIQRIQETARRHAAAICCELGIPLYLHRPDETTQIARLLKARQE